MEQWMINDLSKKFDRIMEFNIEKYMVEHFITDPVAKVKRGKELLKKWEDFNNDKGKHNN